MAAIDKSNNSPFTPELLFFTASGRISVIIGIKDEGLGVSLSNLERNLTFVVKGIGGECHQKCVVIAKSNDLTLTVFIPQIPNAQRCLWVK